MLDGTDLDRTLEQASQHLASALDAANIDVFLYRPDDDALVAVGTSDTPMGRRQHDLGLDRLPLEQEGRTVWVYRQGEPFLSRHTAHDSIESRVVTEVLGMHSAIYTPIEVDEQRLGVLRAGATTADLFGEDDLRFLVAAARWLGQLIQRAQLVEALVDYAEIRGRRETISNILTRLTPRQREIASLIAGGLTNDQIAERLVLTPGTVGNHVAHILRRLGARSRVEVAALAAEAGLHQHRSSE